VDSKRIGIQGWSYGGYMSSLCLGVGAHYFKMAIAVAPVGNWRFYDSIYTERYMGLPKDNAKGYDAFSPTHNMNKVEGELLLVHGTADDNVHFQNSVEMVNALIKANVQFEFYMYPDQDHGIGAGRYHLYTKMTDFILENL
jgi:dipeptidyl-peptidase-4